MFEGIWGKLKLKKSLRISHKIFETNFSFDVNSGQGEKFNCYFSEVIC